MSSSSVPDRQTPAPPFQVPCFSFPSGLEETTRAVAPCQMSLQRAAPFPHPRRRCCSPCPEGERAGTLPFSPCPRWELRPGGIQGLPPTVGKSHHLSVPRFSHLLKYIYIYIYYKKKIMKSNSSPDQPKQKKPTTKKLGKTMALHLRKGL